MSCDWGEKLDRYVDNEISGGELTEVEAHLRGCPVCAADALGRLRLKRAVHAAGMRYSPSLGFRLKMEQRARVSKRPPWATRWVTAFAAVAALGLILISAVLWQQHWRSELALSELADLHVSTLASTNPVDVVSTDRHTVKPWFQGKLPFSFNLPELQNSRFKLVGGRVAYFRQSPCAQLLFEVQKHQISVFIFENRAELGQLNSGSSLRSKLGFSSETWADGDLRYFVVGDASPTDVHDLGELLKDAARS